ncbi:hypothetical protein [Cyanobacterium sp. uoEpiScrs1]|nr:hypothetical protein [Cyanobacterium sp. uoEpiScrs1]
MAYRMRTSMILAIESKVWGIFTISLIASVERISSTDLSGC